MSSRSDDTNSFKKYAQKETELLLSEIQLKRIKDYLDSLPISDLTDEEKSKIKNHIDRG